jgi:hypothetical protein
MATRKTTDKPEHDETVVVRLDDGSQVEYATEAEARAAHPRAWVRLKAEVEDDGEDGND